ncbi:hypothetical protein [Salinigranum halophilum]|uniref:hypothetical protein n=1 Tax=Salinigranum halophilum TaxID=2565931 RepID=UPI00191C1C42
MDERFDDPSDEEESEDASTEETTKTSADSDVNGRETGPAPANESEEQQTASTFDESSPSKAGESDDEPLNIREDWDSATIYVEPEQSEDIEITFTRLKKQLKREDITLEKNKHFYYGVFEVAFGEYREETKEKIRELAQQDADQ